MEFRNYISVNCRILNNEEFNELVHDLEHYLNSTDQKAYISNGEEPESWLRNFVTAFENWPERKFCNHRLSISEYLQLEKRISIK